MGGQGSNSKAELLRLWGILKVAMMCGLGSFKIYSDSMFIIKWAKGILKMKAIHLKHWSDRVKTMMNWFYDLAIEHIYRELKDVADSLSKLALDEEAGILFGEE